MRFEIYSATRGWYSIIPYIKYEGLDGSLNAVDGPNAGRVIGDALMVRDLLAVKHKWNITTIPITTQQAAIIEELLMPEFFRIRTDYYTPNTVTTYTVYSNNITKAYVINKGNRELVKLSFPIVER